MVLLLHYKQRSQLPRQIIRYYQLRILIAILIGLPADIVPATFKKKRAAAPRVKGEEGEEKPSKEETERPTGMGRGQR